MLNLDNANERRAVEMCYRTRKTLINPIIDWTDEDVWEFLNEVAKVPHCCLYDKGHKRIGCIGCPMSVNRKKELDEYPKYKQAYLRSFGKMLEERRKAKLDPGTWENAQDVMDWWVRKEN